jgi:uncharacterized protein (DUF488 family)
MRNPFFTIGHSTRPLDEFVQLLRSSDVRLVVDVRRIPRSRTMPQYNADALPRTLGELEIDYEHIPELGGLRSRKAQVPADTNALWKNDSFHNYADYALGDEAFRSGLSRLRELGHAKTCACMCAEAVWWRCHRRIVADYLLAAGEAVFHILGSNRVEPARLTPGATIANGQVTYPPAGHADAARKVQRTRN